MKLADDDNDLLSVSLLTVRDRRGRRRAHAEQRCVVDSTDCPWIASLVLVFADLSTGREMASLKLRQQY
jgi:hypothetical protein